MKPSLKIGTPDRSGSSVHILQKAINDIIIKTPLKARVKQFYMEVA